MTITVFAKEAEINPTVSPTPIYVDNAITITANVTDEDDEIVTVGKLVLTKDDEFVDECELTTGTATFNIAAYTEAAEETYVLKYVGSENYEVEDAEVIVTVIQVPATINAENIPDAIATEETNIPFTITHTDELVMQGTATITQVDENGEFIANITTIDLANENTTFTITPAEGTYYYNISLTDNKYTADNVTITVTASKVEATIVVNDTVNGYVDEYIPVVIAIQDRDGNAVTQGTITILKDGMLYNSFEVTGESTTINFVYPETDSETITIKYEDDKYTADDKNVTVSSHRMPTSISVEDQTVKVDDTVTITATILDVNNNPVTTGTVRFKDSEGNIVKTVSLAEEDPVYTYTATDAVTEEYTVEYRLNYRYVNSTATSTITVEKYDTTLTVNSPTVNVDDEVTITATIVDENNNPVTTGKVQFTDADGNIVYTANLANGDEPVYTYTSTVAGVEEYTVAYLGTYKYDTDNAISTVTTNKREVTMDTEFDEYTDVFGKDINVIVTIKDAEENPITQGTITVYETDELVQTVEVTGDETVITFNYPEAGAHTLVLKYSDDKYTADDKEIVVLAEAKEAVIISEDVDAFVGDNVVITASVECDGVEVTEGQIRFTNSNGEVLAVCDLSDGPATYDYGVVDEEFDDEVTVEFINSDNYYSDGNFIFVEVIKKYADIELTTSEAKVGSPVTVTARVSYEDESLTEGQIVFTDEEGNEIDTVDIADGVATTTVQYDTVGTFTVYAKIISPTYDGEESIDITIEKIPVTISVIDDQTVAVGDTVTVTATISSDNAIVNGGKVVFTKGSTILAEVDVTEGSASFDYRPTTSGETTITAKYIPSEIYSIEEDTASCVITAERIATTTTIDEVTLVAGKTVTLTARITADDDSIVDSGKVAFKVNGKTLKDSNGKVIYVKVVNGVASLDYTVSDSLLGKDVSIEAVYSGSNKYVNSKDKDSELSVMSGVADIEITSPGTVTKGQIATFTVKVTDNNVNVNEGKVILKINGKTLKNTEGKVIYAQVVEGIATVEYMIPDTMKSKDYTLSAVFVSSNYSRCVDEQTLTVQ